MCCTVDGWTFFYSCYDVFTWVYMLHYALSVLFKIWNIITIAKVMPKFCLTFPSIFLFFVTWNFSFPQNRLVLGQINRKTKKRLVLGANQFVFIVGSLVTFSNNRITFYHLLHELQLNITNSHVNNWLALELDHISFCKTSMDYVDKSNRFDLMVLVDWMGVILPTEIAFVNPVHARVVFNLNKVGVGWEGRYGTALPQKARSHSSRGQTACIRTTFKPKFTDSIIHLIHW